MSSLFLKYMIHFSNQGHETEICYSDEYEQYAVTKSNQQTFTCSYLTINTRKTCEICSELTIKTPERRR